MAVWFILFSPVYFSKLLFPFLKWVLFSFSFCSFCRRIFFFVDLFQNYLISHFLFFSPTLFFSSFIIFFLSISLLPLFHTFSSSAVSFFFLLNIPSTFLFCFLFFYSLLFFPLFSSSLFYNSFFFFFLFPLFRLIFFSFFLFFFNELFSVNIYLYRTTLFLGLQFTLTCLDSPDLVAHHLFPTPFYIPKLFIQAFTIFLSPPHILLAFIYSTSYGCLGNGWSGLCTTTVHI